MYSSAQILQQVNHYIDHLSYDRKPESLYEPIKYVLSLGGKRIRPVLMLLAYNLYKDDPESILSSACALETYHNDAIKCRQKNLNITNPYLFPSLCRPDEGKKSFMNIWCILDEDLEDKLEYAI